jgi:hypothetical protein
MLWPKLIDWIVDGRVFVEIVPYADKYQQN